MVQILKIKKRAGRLKRVVYVSKYKEAGKRLFCLPHPKMIRMMGRRDVSNKTINHHKWKEEKNIIKVRPRL